MCEQTVLTQLLLLIQSNGRSGVGRGFEADAITGTGQSRTLVRQFRCFQKGEAPGWRRNDMGQPARMHHDRVAIPEIDGRKIARQDLLRFNIIVASTLLIGALRSIIQQRVQLRVRVVSSVRTLRREALSKTHS